MKSIDIIELIGPTDKKQDMKEFDVAGRKEIQGHLKRGTWKLGMEDESPSDANILSGRFVLSIRDSKTEKSIYKARFVVQGYRDKDKDFLIHEANNLQQSSIKTVIALAAFFSFLVWSRGVSQAYFQSASMLIRDL